MAVDKLVDSAQLDADLASVADAIRTKGGTSAQLAFPADFVQAIEDIETGGGGDEQFIIDFIACTLTSISRDDIITVGYKGLYSRSNIKSISLPNCVTVREQGIRDCLSLSSLHLPKVTSIEPNGIRNCRLNGIVLPSIKSIGTDCFYQNGTGFTYADFGTLGSSDVIGLGAYVFEQLANFNLLILRNSAKATLGNVNAFANTPFSSNGAGGTIYIPKSLYDHLGDGTALDYQVATNWSTIHGYGKTTWAQIEGSIYETQYADGTPIA